MKSSLYTSSSFWGATTSEKFWPSHRVSSNLIRSLMQSFQFVIFILVMSLFTSSSHLFFGLPNDYNWINQLSNTTIWLLDICRVLHRYQLHVSALMAIFRLIDWQQTCKQLYFDMRLVYGGGGVGVGWGYEISCVFSREGDVGAWILLCRPYMFRLLWPSSGW